MSSALMDKYKLATFNGKVPEASEITLALTVGPDADIINVRAKVYNLLKGMTTYTNGKLQGDITSASKGGSDYQMTIENAIIKGFRSGFDTSRLGDTLTLSSERDTLTFTAA